MTMTAAAQKYFSLRVAAANIPSTIIFVSDTFDDVFTFFGKELKVFQKRIKKPAFV